MHPLGADCRPLVNCSIGTLGPSDSRMVTNKMSTGTTIWTLLRTERSSSARARASCAWNRTGVAT